MYFEGFSQFWWDPCVLVVSMKENGLDTIGCKLVGINRTFGISVIELNWLDSLLEESLARISIYNSLHVKSSLDGHPDNFLSHHMKVSLNYMAWRDVRLNITFLFSLQHLRHLYYYIAIMSLIMPDVQNFVKSTMSLLLRLYCWLYYRSCVPQCFHNHTPMTAASWWALRTQLEKHQ